MIFVIKPRGLPMGVHKRFAWIPVRVLNAWVWLEPYWLAVVRNRLNGRPAYFESTIIPGDTPTRVLDRVIPEVWASIYDRGGL